MSNNQDLATQKLDARTCRELLRTLWMSRHGDLREQSLIRQGSGWFHIAGMGHEALAAFALHLEPDDFAFPFYRDRAFCLQRGVSNYDLALAFYAKRNSSSGGRQLSGHHPLARRLKGKGGNPSSQTRPHHRPASNNPQHRWNRLPRKAPTAGPKPMADTTA